MERKLFLAGEFKAAESSSPDFILKIEGYASTRDVDRVNDIVEPSAFAGTMATFMKFPVLLLNHDSSQTPVGKVLSYRIDDKGLWIEAGIINTERGREVKALIDAGILHSFSIGFRLNRFEQSDDPTAPTRILELELIEISVVSSPANTAALFEQAKQKNINLKSIVSEDWRGKGIQIMEPKEVQALVEPVANEVKTAKATIADVQAELGNVKKLVGELKDVASNKNDSELRTLVDKATADFVKETERLNARIEAVQKQRGVEGGMISDVKSMVENQSRGQIKGVLPDRLATDVVALQRKMDEVVWVDALMAADSQNRGGDYHRMKKVDRIKSLNAYREFSEFAKAMYSTGATVGDEWVPTLLSPTLIEDIRLRGRVAPLFREFTMPSNPWDVPTQGSPTIATLAAEKTAVLTALEQTEQDFGTGKVTFTAEKLRGRYQISTELTEDSAIAIMPFAQDEIIYSLARGKDQAIVNGQETGTFDSGYTIAATDAKTLCDGLRYKWYVTINSSSAGSAAGVNLGAFTDDGLRTIRGQMGKYGELTEDLVWLFSIKGYLMRVIRDLGDYHTMEKFGNNAVIVQGQIDKLDGIPIVVSEFVADNLNSSGIYSGAGNTRSTALLVHRPSFATGIRRRDEMMVERDILWDVYQVVAYHRFDFQPLRTPSSTNVTVNAGYDIDVAS